MKKACYLYRADQVHKKVTEEHHPYCQKGASCKLFQLSLHFYPYDQSIKNKKEREPIPDSVTKFSVKGHQDLNVSRRIRKSPKRGYPLMCELEVRRGQCQFKIKENNKDWKMVAKVESRRDSSNLECSTRGYELGGTAARTPALRRKIQN